MYQLFPTLRDNDQRSSYRSKLSGGIVRVHGHMEYVSFPLFFNFLDLGLCSCVQLFRPLLFCRLVFQISSSFVPFPGLTSLEVSDFPDLSIFCRLRAHFPIILHGTSCSFFSCSFCRVFDCNYHHSFDCKLRSGIRYWISQNIPQHKMLYWEQADRLAFVLPAAHDWITWSLFVLSLVGFAGWVGFAFDLKVICTSYVLTFGLSDHCAVFYNFLCCFVP